MSHHKKDSSLDVTEENQNNQTNTVISPKHDKHKASVLKRLRGHNELCVIPDRVLHRLQVRLNTFTYSINQTKGR